MIDKTLDSSLLVNALFVLMFTAVLSFLIISRKIRSDEFDAESSRFYWIYFLCALVGWGVLWIKETLGVVSDFRLSVFLYVGVTGILVMAVLSQRERLCCRVVAIVVHLAVGLLAFFISSNLDLLLLASGASMVSYSIISVISFKRAAVENNLGHSIIGFAALLVGIAAPFQIYQVVFRDNFEQGFAILFMATTSGFVLVGIGYLSSVLVRDRQKLTEFALMDPLTGLHNRRGLTLSMDVTLNQASRHDRKVSVIVADIDHFKKINDRHGHDAGDSVLRAFSESLKRESREGDVCARLGGEEFALVLPETDAASASAVAERIRSTVASSQVTFKNQSISITSSFGVATHAGQINLESLFADADMALYKAKSTGRNQVCVNS
ncbi:GGDEF domain-containing protein [Marinobacter sp. CHS3-4]|uniref:GGDEF domain-containing protein n=1 Tax=Marinobacter sp. CHS3-4 TaxID=3045174 RepID=UPI0024B586ED|nr:GGDEF domain-containing protein [Marinobacter sp. CHS3-4]MDI9245356.1 GGDEF domain-containing protein [Marinobacter sp. CHS3-4]